MAGHRNPVEWLHAVSSELDDRLSCPVCLDALRDPVITRCGHTFCKSCITASLQAGFGCPCCRKACDPAHLVPNGLIRDVKDHLRSLLSEISTSERAFASLQQEARLAEQRCQQLQQELREQRSRLEEFRRLAALQSAEQNEERSAAQRMRGRAAASEEAILHLMSLFWQQDVCQHDVCQQDVCPRDPEDPQWGLCSMCSSPVLPATGVFGEFGIVCRCSARSGCIQRGGMNSGSVGLKISPDLKWNMKIQKDYCVGGVAHEERRHAAGRVRVEGESLTFTDGMIWESGGDGFCKKCAVPSFSGRLCGVEGAAMMVLSGAPGGGGIMIKNPGDHFSGYKGAVASCSVPEASGIAFPKAQVSPARPSASQDLWACSASGEARACEAPSARCKAAARPASGGQGIEELRSAVHRWGMPDFPEGAWEWNLGETASL